MQSAVRKNRLKTIMITNHTQPTLAWKTLCRRQSEVFCIRYFSGLCQLSPWNATPPALLHTSECCWSNNQLKHYSLPQRAELALLNCFHTWFTPFILTTELHSAVYLTDKTLTALKTKNIPNISLFPMINEVLCKVDE